MHELAVTESILEIALRHASRVNAQRITTLNLVIGQMASVVDDSIQFYWDMIAKGTLAEGANLNFTRLPAEFTCKNCQAKFAPVDSDFNCPACGSSSVILTSGSEFFLDSIEIEN